MDTLSKTISARPGTWTVDELLAEENKCLVDITQRISALEGCFRSYGMSQNYGNGKIVHTYSMPDGVEVSDERPLLIALYAQKLGALYTEKTATLNRIITLREQNSLEQNSGI